MLDILINLCLTVVAGGIFLSGLAAFGYGLYSMSVKGFDKGVRNFSLIAGILLISIAVSIYLFSSH